MVNRDSVAQIRYGRDLTRSVHQRSRRCKDGYVDFGNRAARMFDSGELRLVVLALVAEKERYGYEIIKELSKRVGSSYRPSSGVVYPTLTLLVSMGHARVRRDAGGRKLYTLTPEGEKLVHDNKAEVDVILARLPEVNDPVERSTLNLLAKVRARVLDRAANPDQIQAIVDTLDATARRLSEVSS